MSIIRDKRENQGLRLIVRRQPDESVELDLETSLEKYTFKLNSDDGVESKDRNIMIELTIEGKLAKEVAGEASVYFTEWALDDTDEAYRYVELMKYNVNVCGKKYVLPNAFVVDYEESTNNKSDDHPKFSLFIKQNKDERSDFSVTANEIAYPSEIEE